MILDYLNSLLMSIEIQAKNTKDPEEKQIYQQIYEAIQMDIWTYKARHYQPNDPDPTGECVEEIIRHLYCGF